MASVIIPVHNEERVLGATLEALLRDAQPDEFDVVVALNGCTDRSVEVARSFAPAVRCVVVGAASKTAALNAAEAVTSRFPRIYLDADVIMPTDTARALVRALQSEKATLAVPTAEVFLPGATRVVRLYNNFWYELSRLRRDLGGTGVYSLNEPARRLFATFPGLVADDLFILSTYEHACQVQVPETVVVRPPQRVKDLLAVRTRVYAGNAQFAQLTGDRWALSESGLSDIRHLLGAPRWWPGLATYVAITGLAKHRAASGSRAGRSAAWARDESSRR